MNSFWFSGLTKRCRAKLLLASTSEVYGGKINTKFELF